jgi:hypothetical protein
MMKQMRGRRGRDRMAVGFIATYVYLVNYFLLAIFTIYLQNLCHFY